MQKVKMYAIPNRFRKLENLHIVLWLLKDLGWAMLWRPIGVIMLFPTLLVAALITWQTRKVKSELYHNLAILCWISANGFWMITELWNMPDSYRYYTSIPFGAGLFFILCYYLIILPKEQKQEKTIQITVDVPEAMLEVAGKS